MIKKYSLQITVAFSLLTLLNTGLVHANTTGKASWYQCCKQTANGERFNPDGLTAAHPTLPFGTQVEVENLKNGKKVVVRINDRGPYTKGRMIDLSRGAAKVIGLINSGVTNVKMKIVK